MATGHSYAAGTCTVCGAAESNGGETPDNNRGGSDTPVAEEGGLGAGAIVGIVLGAVALLGGGFALYRFVIRKKKAPAVAPEVSAEDEEKKEDGNA